MKIVIATPSNYTHRLVYSQWILVVSDEQIDKRTFLSTFRLQLVFSNYMVELIVHSTEKCMADFSNSTHKKLVTHLIWKGQTSHFSSQSQSFYSSRMFPSDNDCKMVSTFRNWPGIYQLTLTMQFPWIFYQSKG